MTQSGDRSPHSGQTRLDFRRGCLASRGTAKISCLSRVLRLVLALAGLAAGDVQADDIALIRLGDNWRGREQ